MRSKFSVFFSQENEVGTDVERGIVISCSVSCYKPGSHINHYNDHCYHKFKIKFYSSLNPPCEFPKSVAEADIDLVTTFSFSKITFIVIRESSSLPAETFDSSEIEEIVS